jgi:hypothetical protein
MSESPPNKKRVPIWADENVAKVAKAYGYVRLETPTDMRAGQIHKRPSATSSTGRTWYYFFEPQPEGQVAQPTKEDLLKELDKGTEAAIHAVSEIRHRGLTDERYLKPLRRYMDCAWLDNTKEVEDLNEAADLVSRTLMSCRERMTTADLWTIFFVPSDHENDVGDRVISFWHDPRGIRRKIIQDATSPALKELERRMAAVSFKGNVWEFVHRGPTKDEPPEFYRPRPRLPGTPRS